MDKKTMKKIFFSNRNIVTHYCHVFTCTIITL